MKSISSLIVEMYNEVMYNIENNLFEERLSSKESFRKAIALWKNLPQAKKEAEAKRILKASKKEGYIVKQKEILSFSDDSISNIKAKKSVRKEIKAKKKAKREEKFNKIVDTVEDKDLENKTRIELLALATKKGLKDNLYKMNREELLTALKPAKKEDKKEEVDGSEIIVKGGLKLYKGKPFTGTYTHKNKKGSYISITEVKDGKNHGLSTYFYPNGKKEFEANYVNGVKDGELIDYDKNGNVKSKEIYKNGKRIK